MSDRVKCVFIPSLEPHYLNQNPSFVENIYFTYTYCKNFQQYGSVTMSVSTWSSFSIVLSQNTSGGIYSGWLKIKMEECVQMIQMPSLPAKANMYFLAN